MSYRNPLHGLDSSGEFGPTGAGPTDAADRAERLIAATERYVREVRQIQGELPDTPRVADGETEAFRAATGHDCPACPTAVRDLFATAHNAAGAWDTATRDDDWARAYRKARELDDAVARFQSVVDAHFAALTEWRRQ